MKIKSLWFVVLILVLGGWRNIDQGASPKLYLSPRPGARYVSPGTSLSIRTGDPIATESLNAGIFTVTGSESGAHAGKIVLADDGMTVVFLPEQPFERGESVSVKIGYGLASSAGKVFPGTAYQFQVSARQASLEVQARLWIEELVGAGDLPASQSEAQMRTFADYRTLPEEFPPVAVTVPDADAEAGYVFVSPFMYQSAVGKFSNSYITILDPTGEPVFFRRMPIGTSAFDFKKQPNGLLTYCDLGNGVYWVLDSTYAVVDSWQAGNGYRADFHDIQLLPNGHALLLIYDSQVVDMSEITPGGNPEATVVGLIIQELDADKNVVFEWRSWDHFEITDSIVDLTTETVDYVHGNAVELDKDGNLMISSRNMNEITKIDRQSGEIIWRWGGKHNQFTFVNDPEEQFYRQHDIRRAPNGNVTLFDNRTNHTPVYSRAVEYKLDEEAKTARLAWEHRNVPDIYSQAMANVQRLANGNTVIGWGTAYPSMNEVTRDEEVVFELTFGSPFLSYRAFRFPWQGTPAEPPALVVETEGSFRNLFFSWNGATGVAAYRIYGGNSQSAMELLQQAARTGFETSVQVFDPAGQYCYFQVSAVDAGEKALGSSRLVRAGGLNCQTSLYFPQVVSP